MGPAQYCGIRRRPKQRNFRRSVRGRKGHPGQHDVSAGEGPFPAGDLRKLVFVFSDGHDCRCGGEGRRFLRRGRLRIRHGLGDREMPSRPDLGSGRGPGGH